MALDYAAPETIQILAMLDETRELHSNGMRRGLSNGVQRRPVRPSAADAAPPGRRSRYAIFEYLAIFHNRQRRHSALGMLTPVEFEAVYQPTTAA
jgi:transposase InsO family protein